MLGINNELQLISVSPRLRVGRKRLYPDKNWLNCQDFLIKSGGDGKMSDEEIEGKGFVIKDRRRFTDEGEPKEEAPAEEKDERPESGTEEQKKVEPEAAAEEPEQMPFPEINFSTFIFSLNTSALLHLGEVPDPATGKQQVDLVMAKQTIDLIAMLEEKTRGNLTSDEENLVKHILYDLRLRYVQKAK